MSEKITRIPISYTERDYNLHGTGYVPCNISERWLQFSKTYCDGNGLVLVDVMTTGKDEHPRKICSLCLNIYDLKKELEKIIPE